MQDWGKGPDDIEQKVVEIKNHLKNKFSPQKGVLPLLIVIVGAIVGFAAIRQAPDRKASRRSGIMPPRRSRGTRQVCLCFDKPAHGGRDLG